MAWQGRRQPRTHSRTRWSARCSAASSTGTGRAGYSCRSRSPMQLAALGSWPPCGWPRQRGAEERDDAALLRGVTRGDEEALAALYDRPAGWLTVRMTRRCAVLDVVNHAVQ